MDEAGGKSLTRLGFRGQIVLLVVAALVFGAAVAYRFGVFDELIEKVAHAEALELMAEEAEAISNMADVIESIETEADIERRREEIEAAARRWADVINEIQRLPEEEREFITQKKEHVSQNDLGYGPSEEAMDRLRVHRMMFKQKFGEAVADDLNAVVDDVMRNRIETIEAPDAPSIGPELPPEAGDAGETASDEGA